MHSTLANQKSSQPKGLYLTCSLKMWEAFSYFGMRAILVLYVIKALGFDDSTAYGTYAIYIALVEGLGIFGGKIADKYLGLKNAIVYGGILMAVGHIVLSLPLNTLATLYLGLAFIAVGAGLFNTNLGVLLGEFYQENDPRRDSGYTYYYVWMNFGGLLATIFCAYTAHQYGWHYGFLLAAFGMVLGLSVLYKYQHIMAGKGARPKETSAKLAYSVKFLVLAFVPVTALLIYNHTTTLPLLLLVFLGSFIYTFYTAKKLHKIERHHVYSILLSIIFLIIFYMFEEQIGSLLVVFSERFGEHTFYEIAIPSQSLISVNPAVILIFGPMIGYLLEQFERANGRPVNVFSKIALAFALLAVCFAILYLSAEEGKKTAIVIIALSFAAMALGELFIGPVVYSHASARAPAHMKGLMMGMVMVGFASANALSGVVAKTMAIESNVAATIDVYTDGFLKITVFCILMVAVLLSLKLFRLFRE